MIAEYNQIPCARRKVNGKGAGHDGCGHIALLNSKFCLWHNVKQSAWIGDHAIRDALRVWGC
jgi:hypothetical protein